MEGYTCRPMLHTHSSYFNSSVTALGQTSKVVSVLKYVMYTGPKWQTPLSGQMHIIFACVVFYVCLLMCYTTIYRQVTFYKMLSLCHI